MLNIWIAALPPEDAGFAQMPERGLLETDGVVINYRYFGMTDSPYFGQGKTLTFLIAQYLNLYPLSGHSLDFPCSDDFVDDTPLHNSRNYGCPSSNHVSICTNKLVPEMLMNFMSANTSDNCKYMFTRGQAARMQAVLDPNGSRYDLVALGSICTAENLVNASARNTNLSDTTLLEDGQLHVYPNPASSLINIQLNGVNQDVALIELLTADGKLVLSKNVATNSQNLETTIDISHLTTGLYLVKIQTNQSSLVQKITIE